MDTRIVAIVASCNTLSVLYNAEKNYDYSYVARFEVASRNLANIDMLPIINPMHMSTDDKFLFILINYKTSLWNRYASPTHIEAIIK